ncbi:beta-galactosidase [uncultured Jatrophihabitans sp.]|uniref:beta-galactosidase n=1 Tax=uncultured Jatrophihabitans sp. TaxID=1610747 RepID=UPI0035CA029B
MTDAGTRSGIARFVDALGGRLAFGADYNPEQWPARTWSEDVALMRQVGVNVVTLGVFAWALLEPAEGEYDLAGLDDMLDLLHDNGIRVDLATGTASPPAWFSTKYPHTLPVDQHGVRRGFGARQGYCPSAPEYRAAAGRLAGTLAARYAQHPAVVLWHVNNEYGCHNWHCYCDVSAGAFRGWLRRRYGDLDALNTAWGTSFWSQRYTAWEQLGPPRDVTYNSLANPGQQLDWWRFGNDELLACYRVEADAVRGHATQPVTTNFMSFFKPLDYRQWAAEVDVVSNDHYLLGEDPARTHHLAMSADLMRSLAGGAPWLLMEHSTSAVNWQPRNLAKAPGELLRNSLTHIARGADGTLFFQWRASRFGAEKFHSALVPHAGTDTKVFREVAELGAALEAIRDVRGSRVEQPQVALLFDWQSWWAAGLDAHPSVDVDPMAEARRWHHALWSRNVAADVVGPGDALDRYRVVVVAVQYLLDDETARKLADFTRAGGTVVATFFSGIVDEHDHVRLGGYPGALRDLLGVRVEEFFPLAADEHVLLSAFGSGRVWSELGATAGADVLASYAEGPVAGSPAVTRRVVGDGQAWYVGTSLDDRGLDDLVGQLLVAAGVEPVVSGLPPGVEAVRRVGESGRFLFLVNHSGDDVPVPLSSGVELLTGRSLGDGMVVPAGGVAVVREA